MVVTLDGEPVYELKTGQGWTFQIDAGFSRLGYELGFNACQRPVTFELGGRYRILLTSICEIEPKSIE